jgi:hypothetical protein
MARRSFADRRRFVTTGFEALVATGLNVQHVFDDCIEDHRAYVGVRCLACTGIHLVSRTTGRLVSDKADE